MSVLEVTAPVKPPADGALHTLVTSRAREVPDAVAITLGADSITYRDLVERAGALAVDLVKAGAVADTFVGVCVDRSVTAIVGLLGVLMSGAAYVPLAADLPVERARMVIHDARIRIVTGVPAPALWDLAETTVPEPGPEPDRDRPRTGRDPVALPVPAAHPEHAAYAIFTSGSTGRPKGVVAPHRAVVSSTLARFKVFPHESMTYLMLAPLTFDAAVAGLYFTLAAGGRLLVPTQEEVLDPGLLADLANRESATHIDGVASQYAPLIAYHPRALRGVRCVVLAGEPLPFRLVRDHFAVAPEAVLFNEYGPTEGTVWSAIHRCSPDDDGPLAPVGHAIDGVRISVLDEDLNPVPQGEVGEIVIGGRGLARGYLGAPAMTAERFVPDPNRHGERIYRTGDTGWFDPDGLLIYHGRADHMVKVRGFRVELGEVEARLREHPDVAAAVVVASDGGASVRLVAVLAARPGRLLSAGALIAFAAEKLPQYMIPTAWRGVDSLPLTSHGKADRQALTVGWAGIGAPLPH